MFELLSFRRPFEELNRGLLIQEQLADGKKTYQDLIRGFSKTQLDAYFPLLQLFSQCCAIDPSGCCCFFFFFRPFLIGTPLLAERPTVSFLIVSLKNIIVQAGGVQAASPKTRERSYSSYK